MYNKFIDFYNNYFKNHTNDDFLLVYNLKTFTLTVHVY